MKAALKVLKSRKGDMFITSSVIIFVVVVLLIITVNVFMVIGQIINLDYFSSELIETAAAAGRIGPEVDSRYNELCEQTGLTPTVTWTASYHNASKRTVQLADTISVKLSFETSLPAMGDFFELTIPLERTKSRLSKMYWK